MRRSTIIALIAMAPALALLLSLGTWQLHRLAWKEALIASVEARMADVPVPLGEAEKRFAATGDVDYLPVTVSGTFDHGREVYFYNTWSGQAGWNVITPLRLEDGRFLLVNRGFVPMEFRDPATRPAAQVAGTQAFKGLARNPVLEKPNRFIPDNAPGKREFYWKGQDEMRQAISAPGEDFLPFMVDAWPENQPYQWPRGSTTLVSFPNNHLQYAITWYGLALALLGVGSYFLYSSRKT